MAARSSKKTQSDLINILRKRGGVGHFLPSYTVILYGVMTTREESDITHRSKGRVLMG